jgi:hypothetical protein
LRRTSASSDARASRRRPRVDRELGGRSRFGGLAAVAVGAPERLVVHGDRLGLGAADRVAIERLAILLERRLERDLERERGRHRHHGVARRDEEPVGFDGDAVAALGDRAHGRPQPHRHAERVGDPARDLARAAVDEVLLRAVLDREQRVDAAVRVREIEQVEQRDLGEVRSHQAPQRRLEQIARNLRAHAAALEPPLDRARVPLGRARRGPRRVERHLARHPVDRPVRECEREHRERGDLRDQARVAARAPTADQQMCARHVRLVRGDAHLLREAEDRVVARAEPRAAAVDRGAVRQLLRPDPPAHAVARFEHDHRLPRLNQPPRRGEPGITGADHADVRFEPLGHAATLAKGVLLEHD